MFFFSNFCSGLKCFVKFGTPSVIPRVIQKNAFEQIFTKLYKLIFHYLIRIPSKFEWIPAFSFDFIRGQSLTSHDPFTRRLLMGDSNSFRRLRVNPLVLGHLKFYQVWRMIIIAQKAFYTFSKVRSYSRQKNL